VFNLETFSGPSISLLSTRIHLVAPCCVRMVLR
jgi:hypothetical protein